MAGIWILATEQKVTESGLVLYFYLSTSTVAFVKLFIYFHFGEKIPNSFNELKNTLNELSLTNHLSNDDWKQWIAIKEMKPEFYFTILNILQLKRETAITVALFILQYVVILIQTNVEHNK